MLTFLPDQYAKAAAREYRVRLLFIASSLSTIALLAALAFSLPAYLALKARAAVSVAPVASTVSGVSDIETVVRDITEKSEIIKGIAESQRISVVIERAVSKRSRGIGLSGISFRRGIEKGAISLSGKAETREDLVLFVKNLESEPSFAKVDLPVSALAKGKDITFSLSIDSSF